MFLVSVCHCSGVLEASFLKVTSSPTPTPRPPAALLMGSASPGKTCVCLGTGNPPPATHPTPCQSCTVLGSAFQHPYSDHRGIEESLFYCALSQLSWCSSPPTAIHAPQKQRGGSHLLRAFCVPDIVPSTLILNSQSENRDRGFKNMTVFPFTCGRARLQVHMLLAVLGDPAQLGCSSIP